MRAWPLLFVLCLGLAGCASFWTGSVDPVPAPPFATTDTDGQPVNLSQEGPVLIDFMGTWCGPCQRAVPVIQDLRAAYPDLEVVSFSSTDTAEQINDFRARHGADWPHVADDGRIVDAYREAGTTAGSMMWPSYALVVDGELVFYNRGETLPATFAAAIDQHVDRAAPAITADVAGPALLAMGMGALAWFTPWLRPIVMEASPRRSRRSPLIAVALFTTLGALAAFASRPLSGRVATVAPFLAAAGIVAVGLWRWRGAKPVTGKRIEGDGAGHAWALHGNLLWYSLPAWGAVLHGAMLRTAPWESLLMVTAFGMGAAVADTAVLAKRVEPLRAAGERAGWLGATALLIGAAWNGLLYIR